MAGYFGGHLIHSSGRQIKLKEVTSTEEAVKSGNEAGVYEKVNEMIAIALPPPQTSFTSR